MKNEEEKMDGSITISVDYHQKIDYDLITSGPVISVRNHQPNNLAEY